MPSSLLLILSYTSLLAHAAVSLPSHYTTISRDVVVIGGGSSGTYAAVNLHARGRSVAILEQKGRLGGHVETYHDNAGVPHNLGVVVYYNNTINNAYFSLLGVPTAPLSVSATGNIYLDFATGKTVPNFNAAAQIDSFFPAMLAYGAYINATYPYLTLSYENLTYPLPAELLEPFTVFAARHNFTAFLQFFNKNAQNIGNLWELPTYQGIHAFDTKLIDAVLTGLIHAASGDNQDIYNAAAAYLGPQNVFLNSTILDVDRSGACFGLTAKEHEASGVCILSTSPSSSGNVTLLTKARKLLVAIPPSLPSLAAAHLDLDAHEHALFAKLHGFTYGVTVFSHPGLNSSDFYANIGTHTPDNLLTLPGAFEYSPLPDGRFASYFGALEESGFLDADVEALVRGEIARMVKHGTVAGDPNDVTFDFLKIHAPFRLSPSAHDVASGVYKELYALEGRRNTFWTGAAWTEQDSSQIWWWSELSLLPKMEAALN
ncbi:hypothetical protein B0H19DRAFT_672683 [Mycena capillaripes]|nr:hypothetical protein B0H19DRAFT_672683 [Mycena capillaripes]